MPFHGLGIELPYSAIIGGGISQRQPTYYFSAAGSDANDGKTLATPKQTLTAFNALTLVATDYVAFRKGDTFPGTMTIPGGGSALSTVIIGAYGILANPIIAPTSGSDGIDATNLSYLTIDSLTASGLGGSTGRGIHVLNSSGNANSITIQNCTATGFGLDGIAVRATGGSITTLNITNCTSYSNTTAVVNGSCGIRVSGVYGAQVAAFYGIKSATISNCTAHDNTGAAGTTNWVGSGIFMSQCDTGTITGCVAYNNGALNNAASGPCGIWTADSKFVTIQFSESYDNKSASNDGAGFDLDGGCDNCIIQYCYSHGNNGSGLTSFNYTDVGKITGSANCKIRYNISSRDCQSASFTTGAIFVVSATSSSNSQIHIYGNTVYCASPNSASACLYINNGGGVSGFIANNIFVSSNVAKLYSTTGSAINANMYVTGNCYQNNNTFSITWSGSSYSTYAAWQTATSLEMIGGSNVGVNSSALLINPGYSGTNAASNTSQKNSQKLQASSPCVGTGVDLVAQYSESVGGRDYYGAVVPSGGLYNIGCGGVGTPSGSVTVTFAGHAEDATSQTTYTFSSVSIGTADPSRLVGAVITSRLGANTTAVASGVTINGIAASLVTDGRNTASGNLSTETLWQAPVPTGTTATVVVTFSTAMSRAAVATYSVVGSSGELPLDGNTGNFTNAGTGAVSQEGIVVPFQGASIIGSFLASGTGSFVTPTNYTTDLAATALGPGFYSTGKDNTYGSRSYTSTWGGTTPLSATGVAVAWMPPVV